MRNLRQLKGARRSIITTNRLKDRSYFNFCIKIYGIRRWWEYRYYFNNI